MKDINVYFTKIILNDSELAWKINFYFDNA